MSKIHFIPSERYTGEQMLPVQGSATYNVNGIAMPVQAAQFVRIPSPPVFSPFYEALGFLGGKTHNVHTFSDLHLSLRFWERWHLIEWMEANMTRPVLVQIMNGDGGTHYRFGFASCDDANAFASHVNRGAFRGTFEFDVEEPVYNEIQEWVRLNISCDAEVRRVGYGRRQGRVKMAVKIKDLSQAALFKLRWHGEGTDPA